MSLEERELWGGVDLELQHGTSEHVEVLVPPSAVITGIHGGSLIGHKVDSDNRFLGTGCNCTGEEADDANRIVTTVRMEHSYV